MHDDNAQDRYEGRIADPLRSAPPPGLWALWHGPLAEAVLDLARERGRPFPPPAGLPALPAGFPMPQGEPLGTFLLEDKGRRFFIQGDVHNRYVSCYLVQL